MAPRCANRIYNRRKMEIESTTTFKSTIFDEIIDYMIFAVIFKIGPMIFGRKKMPSLDVPPRQ